MDNGVGCEYCRVSCDVVPEGVVVSVFKYPQELMEEGDVDRSIFLY